MTDKRLTGGIIHTYQKYDPKRIPDPMQPPPDLVSPALNHMMYYGSMRELTEEELARAIRLDPSQIAGLGPSLDALLAMLEERKRKILETYETDSVRKKARRSYLDYAKQLQPPKRQKDFFHQAVRAEQIYDLERLWYKVNDDQSPFSQGLVQLVDRLGDKYEIDELAANYYFTGRTSLTIPEALEIKAELEKIDELLKQLEEARETAQIAIIDMEALSEFTQPGDVESLQAMQKQVRDLMREMADQQGLEFSKGQFQLTPKAYRLFQSRILERIFSDLQASRTGRHGGPVIGEGAVEIPSTKPYEFGDSVSNMDIVQSFTNAILRDGPGLPIRLKSDDLVIHKTRNSPKCATTVLMDMSGSMRYEGQYVNVKQMGLALEALIRGEFPGDYLQFIEMYSFAKPCTAGEIVELMPKPVTIFDPVVRLKVDMSDERISEQVVPPHFTNIQHALQLSRHFLATQDTPNRQIILITDGLPTAHFEGEMLYLLYPPDPQTEAATMREAHLCKREGITINIFLIPSWSQSSEDIQFAHRLAEATQGRVFFTAGSDLDRYVVWDYVKQRRDIIG
ncbi:hypothetical protein [uncultured Gimesia sp.]|uniref:hypothetical protein n=1 Tax=uncultured Gimesia sp. TaxID=1678688 RepID=UPI0030D97B9F|tara:strand:+ start:12049 stop:13749 length:1701 start_codon:yes stop_codon:yes gene_type:complete